MTYPSFGSLIDFRLMYSSYSNVPVPRVSPLHTLVRAYPTIEFGVLSVESEFGQEKVDVLGD